MKRIFISIFCTFVFFVPLIADEICDEALREAKQKYNSGQYQKAKDLFLYVQGECGASYGSADSWVQKCNTALNQSSSSTKKVSSNAGTSTTKTLSVNQSTFNVTASAQTKYVTVTSNSTWELANTSSSLFTVTKSSNTVTISINANTTSSTRSDYFDVRLTDKSKSIRVNVYQEAGSSSSSSSSSTLSVSSTYIYASALGETRTLTVSSNNTWEVQYPSGNMYSVSRNGNTLTVRINANTTSSSREDFFNVKTTDGSKTVKISMSQAAGSGTAKSSGSSSTYSRTTSNSSYSQYINSRGVFEITWFSMRAGIGTGFTYSPSIFKLRWGPIQLNPVEFANGYNFISDNLLLNYQPTIDAIIPLGSDHAIYAGVGPVIDLNNNYNWFKIEAGWHLHWGRSASTDFFARYDGAFVIGASIQWSTGW